MIPFHFWCLHSLIPVKWFAICIPKCNQGLTNPTNCNEIQCNFKWKYSDQPSHPFTSSAMNCNLYSEVQPGSNQSNHIIAWNALQCNAMQFEMKVLILIHSFQCNDLLFEFCNIVEQPTQPCYWISICFVPGLPRQPFGSVAVWAFNMGKGFIKVYCILCCSYAWTHSEWMI